MKKRVLQKSFFSSKLQWQNNNGSSELGAPPPTTEPGVSHISIFIIFWEFSNGNTDTIVTFEILTVFFAGGHVEYASRCHPKLREPGRHVPGTVPVGLWVPKCPSAWGAEVSQTTWPSNPSDPLSWGLVSLDWDYCATETRPVKFKQCLPVWKPTGSLTDTPPWCRKCDNHLRIQTSSLEKVTGMVMFEGSSIGSEGIK